MVDDSILNDTKKALGLAADYDVFDQEIIMFINGALADLTQLGVGPVDGFAIQDANDIWSDLLGTDKTLNAVRTWMYLKVRQVFDPPENGAAVIAIEKLLTEATWRINIAYEVTLPPPIPSTTTYW